MKWIIAAYACSPYLGSEPGVGWGYIYELAKQHQLWVLVEEEKFRSHIEEYLHLNPKSHMKSVNFIYITKTRLRFLRKIWPPSYYYFYNRWHLDAFKIAKALHREIGFDISYQLTMVGFREAGYLSRLDLPLHLWGPIGGFGYYSMASIRALGASEFMYCIVYNLLNYIQSAFFSRSKSVAQDPKVRLIAATSEQSQFIYRYWQQDSWVIPEVGLPPKVAHELLGIGLRERPTHSRLQIAWCGGLIPRKDIFLAIEVVSLLKIPFMLNVIGSGPLLNRAKKFARDRGLSDSIVFHGQLSRDKALALMGLNKVMLITSMRDLTSTVTVEALACGIPVVCPDHSGFQDIIDHTNGFRIRSDSRQSFAVHASSVLHELYLDKDKLQALSTSALSSSTRYSYTCHVEKLLSLVNQQL